MALLLSMTFSTKPTKTTSRSTSRWTTLPATSGVKIPRLARPRTKMAFPMAGKAMTADLEATKSLLKPLAVPIPSFGMGMLESESLNTRCATLLTTPVRGW
jgi:hypothetical protein